MNSLVELSTKYWYLDVKQHINIYNDFLLCVLGEYEQNLCSGTSCQPCPSRLPSCVGIPDGDRPFPAHLWTDQYITCLSNRTIAVRHCPSGSVFDPARLQCVNRIEQGLLNLMIHLLTLFCLCNRQMFGLDSLE